jgi:hypothetical protein
MNGPKFLNLVNIEFDEFPLRGFSLSILIKDTQGSTRGQDTCMVALDFLFHLIK